MKTTFSRPLHLIQSSASTQSLFCLKLLIVCSISPIIPLELIPLISSSLNHPRCPAYPSCFLSIIRYQCQNFTPSRDSIQSSTGRFPVPTLLPTYSYAYFSFPTTGTSSCDPILAPSVSRHPPNHVPLPPPPFSVGNLFLSSCPGKKGTVFCRPPAHRHTVFPHSPSPGFQRRKEWCV